MFDKFDNHRSSISLSNYPFTEKTHLSLANQQKCINIGPKFVDFSTVTDL